MSDEHHSDDPAHPEDLRAQAERCRRLSRSVYDRATAEMLDQMARRFESGEQNPKE
jgi:hypothetical protein